MSKRKYSELHGQSTPDLPSVENRIGLLLQQVMTQLALNTQRIDKLSQQMDSLAKQLAVHLELTQKDSTRCSYIS
jgi:hypothetical protein